MGKEEEAMDTARSLLRRDPNYLDMRAALTSFLWASGKESDAEAEWTQLQNTSDGLGGRFRTFDMLSISFLKGEIYRRDVAVKRVQGRWPPRAIAALDAFLNLKRSGESLDYDQKKQVFTF